MSKRLNNTAAGQAWFDHGKEYGEWKDYVKKHGQGVPYPPRGVAPAVVTRVPPTPPPVYSAMPAQPPFSPAPAQYAPTPTSFVTPPTKQTYI